MERLYRKGIEDFVFFEKLDQAMKEKLARKKHNIVHSPYSDVFFE